MRNKVNILGSCVSRVCMLDGNRNGHGIADDDMDLGYYFHNQNIVCLMTPPSFSHEEIDMIKGEELYDANNLRGLRQCLYKDTINMLLESDAQWLVMDLYDMQIDFCMLGKGMFSPYNYEFFNTSLYERYKDQVICSNFMRLTDAVYYGYIDAFFDKIMHKYDSDHIIFNCFRANQYYFAKDGTVQFIPENCRNGMTANFEYNKKLYEVEDYIIQKYNPYVIDLSKYFMGDERIWGDDLNGAHFEEKFYRETFKQIKRIIEGKTKEKYFANPNFFSDADMSAWERFDIENALGIFQHFLDTDDLLWMNILDKLNKLAPKDERVQYYMKCLGDSFA